MTDGHQRFGFAPHFLHKPELVFPSSSSCEFVRQCVFFLENPKQVRNMMVRLITNQICIQEKQCWIVMYLV